VVRPRLVQSFARYRSGHRAGVRAHRDRGNALVCLELHRRDGSWRVVCAVERATSTAWPGSPATSASTSP